MPPDADPLTRLAEYLRLSSPEGSESAATPFDPGWSFWLEFWSKANRDDEIRAEVSDIYGDFAELYREAIRDGVERGEFRVSGQVEDVADRLISLADGLAVRTLLGGLDRETHAAAAGRRARARARPFRPQRRRVHAAATR